MTTDMVSRYSASLLAGAVFLLVPASSFALTLDQFIGICESGPQKCSEHPIAQAYVGGALDVIAVLGEETDYLHPIYCVNPSELFDVPMIISYLTEHRAAYADQNAMIPLLEYLEANGGC